MKSYTLIFAFIAGMVAIVGFIPEQAEAQHSQSQNLITAQDIDAKIIPRMMQTEAEAGITTREGSVDLMLTNEFLIIQFTDTFLENIEKEIQKEREAASSHAGAVVLSMVSSGVRTLLDRAMAVPLSDITDVYYENNRLYIKGPEGRELFRDLEIDGKEIMEDFSRRDARRFVAEAEKRII